MRRAFAIALAACSASARTRAICAASKASLCFEKAPRPPNTSSPASRGETTIEVIPRSVDDPIGSRRMPELRVIDVVGRHDRRSLRDGKAEHPDAWGELQAADPLARARTLDTGVVREA